MPAPAPDARLPVNILTGHLGSGKTTLLRRLLRHEAFADTAVLINEFGEAGLDHLLLDAVRGEPVLLPGGCVCCSVRGDLSRALRDLLGRRRRGALPPFRRVVIETSGLADPTPILATLTSDLVLRHHLRPGNIVATVDALHAAGTLRNRPEAGKQVAVADRLVVTKPDLASPAGVAELRGRLAQLNPAAAITVAAHGEADPAPLLAEDLHTAETRLGEVQRWLATAAVGGAPPHGEGVRGFTLRAAAPLDWTAFGLWLSLLVHRHGDRLLRLKAVLDVPGSTTPVVLHAVQHVIHPPQHLARWPDEARGSRIVVITDGLDAGALERSLRLFLRLGAPA